KLWSATQCQALYVDRASCLIHRMLRQSQRLQSGVAQSADDKRRDMTLQEKYSSCEFNRLIEQLIVCPCARPENRNLHCHGGEQINTKQ
ncbi:MAG TPA: hypothetical protein VNZ53_42625, partial [Steroidobacteraceae bacterium]|nr:hypothetical protein [Steroidobacteraceae bacterium]